MVISEFFSSKSGNFAAFFSQKSCVWVAQDCFLLPSGENSSIKDSASARKFPHQIKKLGYSKTRNWNAIPKTRSQKAQRWETKHSQGNWKGDGTWRNIVFPYCRLSLVSFCASSPISCILLVPLPQSFGACRKPWRRFCFPSSRLALALFPNLQSPQLSGQKALSTAS